MVSPRAAATRGRPRKNWSAPPLWPPPVAASSPLPPSLLPQSTQKPTAYHDTRGQPGQKYHPFRRDLVKIEYLLLTLASKSLLQITRFQLSRGVTDDEKSLSARGQQCSITICHSRCFTKLARTKRRLSYHVQLRCWCIKRKTYNKF